MQDLEEENRPSLMGIIAYSASESPSSEVSLNKWLTSVRSKIDVTHLFQAAVKADMKEEMPSPHEYDEMNWWREYFNGYDFFDDVNGDKPLPWEEVLKAGRLEMDFSEKFGYTPTCIKA